MDQNKILYKYRGGDRTTFERDLNSLVKDFYWSSAIPSLNDPCEALIVCDTYLEELGSLEKVIHSVVSNEINFDDIRTKMTGILEKALTVGVFSLSKNNVDELMWSHYGASHHGFCIGFNMHYLQRTLKKYFYNVLEVNYSKHPPKLKLMEQWSSNDPEMGMTQLIATKSLRWENEQEVRVITRKPGRHCYEYRSVESIYFGLRMPESWKDELMQALQGRRIKYFQMQLSKDAYRFTAMPVTDKYLDAPLYKYKISPVMNDAIEEATVQPHYKQYTGYLFKAVEVARREAYCLEVISCGFSFTYPIDHPIIFVHCKKSDLDYGNFEYSLPELDFLYSEIDDLQLQSLN